MAQSLPERVKKAWNAFRNRDPTKNWWEDDYSTSGSGYPAYRRPLRAGNERSIIASIYNKIAVDVAALAYNHARVDEDGNFTAIIKSQLNECLTTEANIDQSGRDLLQDAVMSMLNDGTVVLVPTNALVNPRTDTLVDILSVRVGTILTWFPKSLRVRCYNDETGTLEDFTIEKSKVCVLHNPFYAVMNNTNSTLQRLIKKLNLLDSIDEEVGAGRLDIIVQMPYDVASAVKRKEANDRIKDLELQLRGHKLGVGYMGATEKITQLNRPMDNTLWTQIEALFKQLYTQLQATESVFNGTASEEEQLNYYSGTIEPIAAVLVNEMRRKWLSKTARTQGQTIIAFRDPFKLVPMIQLADLADSFTRNEILSTNEFRSKIGFKPSKDPRADELRNKNLNAKNDQLPAQLPEKGENQNGTSYTAKDAERKQSRAQQTSGR